jgi:hypothetical protein
VHARVSTYQFPPDRIDAALDEFEFALSDESLEAMRDSVILVDRSSGKAMTITYWETQEAAAASREAATRVRSRATESASGAIQSIEEFEVA